MNELEALNALAQVLGVHTHFTDGLGNPVVVSSDTLLEVCRGLGAPIAEPGDATEALKAHQAARNAEVLPAVVVAWNGVLPPLEVFGEEGATGVVTLEDGGEISLEAVESGPGASHPLPFGYHTLRIELPGGTQECALISSPLEGWRRSDSRRSWGVGTHLAALRSARSRSQGDLRDLESLCTWVGERGGDLVTVLPLLPTFNTGPAEPSPYSPVSRLFWSELILDLGGDHRPAPRPAALDVIRAASEVEAAMKGRSIPEEMELDEELVRYARFRGAQARMGRNWRDWPAPARAGALEPHQIDKEVERFHLLAQTTARIQLTQLRERLDGRGIRLGLDLAVGVHPDGYDPWSRKELFASGMSVGAPPDPGFPSGQDWGFPPVLPQASRREGHRYLAASIAHQAALTGVLRVDHVMAFTRLYWIPHGFGLHQGTYVSYPAEELFAILTLESHRNQCEMVGENLGTVPPEIDEALPRHRIWGTYLALFQAAGDPELAPPTAAEMAQVGTHDTPTFAGWLEGVDIGERVQHRLLSEDEAPTVRKNREDAAQRLAQKLGGTTEDPQALFSRLLDWLGGSESPLVVPWLEDFWLERNAVNLPGTSSSQRKNWQRPMARLLEEVFSDPEVDALIRRLARARSPEPENP